MNKAELAARARLIDYAGRFLGVKARPNEAICVTLEQVAEFSAQLREGCRQDLLRLILRVSSDELQPEAKEALLALGTSINEGESIELWGLPDCACGKSECVYCGRRLNES